MDAARWQLLQTLFQDALALPDETAQRHLLEARHPDDPQLVAEVLAMLHEDRAATSLLDHGIEQVAGSMLGTMVPPGTAFGPYTVTRVLGEGGMGVVCLAERADLGSVAAIKILRDAWLSPARRERFTVEQRVLAQLNHPGIARLYDAGTLADGTPWFAMEYVEGSPLTDYCSEHRCSIDRRLQLFRQACEAVRFAHAHAVIHRDIKPSNMLVKREGSVRLLDFGIAKQLDGIDQAGGTRTVLRVMTPAYAAPEQLQGGKIGVHTDVYSLGVVLYELLTGRLPFDTRGIAVLENTATSSTRVPMRPSQLARGAAVSGNAPGRASWSDLDVLCLTAMHPDPSRRYSSVEALLRDVDHYLRSEPLDARPDGWSYRTGKFLRRHWQVAGVAAAGLVLLIGLSTVFTLRLARARDAAQAEAARTERVQKLMTSLFRAVSHWQGPAPTSRWSKYWTAAPRGRSTDGGPCGAGRPAAQHRQHLPEAATAREGRCPLPEIPAAAWGSFRRRQPTGGRKPRRHRTAVRGPGATGASRGPRATCAPGHRALAASGASAGHRGQPRAGPGVARAWRA